MIQVRCPSCGIIAPALEICPQCGKPILRLYIPPKDDDDNETDAVRGRE